MKITPTKSVIASWNGTVAGVEVLAASLERNKQTENEYIYRGDRLTDPNLRGQECKAVRRSDGKCIRGKNGNMLVEFESGKAVVLGRQLRKIKKCPGSAAPME
jgi:hypothetical protein